MVERMQTPGEGPGVVVEPIPVESTDEIGRLAEAFNTVNDVTVQVAQEQAALRASIAEMFVNVARRNQVLLGRQLSQLDKMEAREEDPDVLDSLFKLDHLATRMRRNAESLLVLAGIDSTRRLRSTLPLSDVIRTAVGEIEAFDRIDLSMSEDPEVSGRHALTVAHLLAELLENATHFSNPDTRVVVSASVTGHGVDVTVTDYGLGMSEDEVADANDKIAHPPVAEIAVSQRLGLFVVGRLAARLGRDRRAAPRPRRRHRGRRRPAAPVFEGMAAPEPVADEVAAPVFEAETLQAVEDLRASRRSRRTTVRPRRSPSSSAASRPTPRHAAAACCDAAAAADNPLPTPPSPARPSGRRGVRRRGRPSPRSARRRRRRPAPRRGRRVRRADTQEFFLPAEPAEPEPAETVADEPVAEADEQSRRRGRRGRQTPEKPARRGLFGRVAAPRRRRAGQRRRRGRRRARAPSRSPSRGRARAGRRGRRARARRRGRRAGRRRAVAEVVEPEPSRSPRSPSRSPSRSRSRRPAPSVPVVYAPAVDILPSRYRPRGSRFGRHRQPAAAPVAAPYVPAAFAPPAPAPAPSSRSQRRPQPSAAPPSEPEPVRRLPATAPARARGRRCRTEPVRAEPARAARARARTGRRPVRTAGTGSERAAPVAPSCRRHRRSRRLPPRPPRPRPSRSPRCRGVRRRRCRSPPRHPLPGRTAAAPAAPAPEPVVPAGAAGPRPVAAQSELHSSALSELRGLYEPSFTPAAAPAGTGGGTGTAA